MKQIINKYIPWLKKIRYVPGILKSPFYINDFIKFNKLSNAVKDKPKIKDIYPQFADKTKDTNFDAHYIYHPAWAARIVKKNNPQVHVDISSTLHFCSILSAFINTEFYDYRPANLLLDGLKTNKADLCNLHFSNNSIGSLSCMHTVEHIGLGRYGDAIDPYGDIKAIKELQRVLKPGGHLLFVTPVGKPRIQFNAHRIYSFEKIVAEFNELKLVEFSLIPDNALEQGMIMNADANLVNTQNYACGCFHFSKI